MRLTRRGWAVLAVAVAAVLLADAFGARTLNAVVAPALVALVAAVLQVGLRGRPTVDRTVPAPGFPGETVTVELAVEGRGSARVLDRVEGTATVPDGAPVAETHLPATVAYDLDLEGRGEYKLGPPDVTVRDVLGLAERIHKLPTVETGLVYPAVYDLRGEGALAAIDARAGDARGEFDHLREYAPGDALRDIHWPSSAKQVDGLVVSEYAATDREEEVAVAAAGTGEAVDEMAAAAASVAVYALEAGYAVSVAAPGGRLDAGRGRDHREAVLELLARTAAGSPDRETLAAADVVVSAEGSTVTLHVDGRERTLAAVPDGPRHPVTEVDG